MFTSIYFLAVSNRKVEGPQYRLLATQVTERLRLRPVAEKASHREEEAWLTCLEL